MTFKKGQVTNPRGRPKVPDETKLMRSLSRDFVECKITSMRQKSITELEEILKDKDNQSIDHFIGRIILMGVVKGDPVRLNFLFDRVIGKVTDIRELKTVAPFLIESHSGDKTITLGTEEKKGD